MIDVMAQRIARNIKSTVPEHPASENVLRFAIAAILNGVFIVSFSLTLSLFLGTFWETAIVLIAFALLRQMSGGYHLQSGMSCVLVSTAGVTLLSLTSYAAIPDQAIFVINLVNVGLALLFAPSNIEKQTRIKPKYFPLLKFLTTIVVGANLLMGFQLLAVTFLVQCLTLIRMPVRRN